MSKADAHERSKLHLDDNVFSRFEANGDYPNWVIRLNKYQRDNLLWLLTLARNDLPGTNTGDWVAEIAWLISKPDGGIDLDIDDKPNTTLEQWREQYGEK